MNLAGKTIVFQGDSITDMARGRNSWDQNHLYGHSFVFLIASKLCYENPENKTVFYNRGNSGDRSIDVLRRWREDTLDLKPDIVSLFVGINDIIRDIETGDGVSVEDYEKILCRIIEETKKEIPYIRFVLCEPIFFLTSAKKEYRKEFAERVPRQQNVVRHVAEKYNCVFVPLQEDFNNAYKLYPELGEGYWIWDGIHPTAAGHQLIARKWLKVMEEAKDE